MRLASTSTSEALPSAPPLLSSETQQEASLGAPHEQIPQAPTQPDEDRAALYQDLLTRANGDTQLVSLWLAEMGYDPALFVEQQQQQQPRQEPPATIKAVGTRHMLGSWASAGNSKSRLVGSSSPDEVELVGVKDKEDGDLDAEAAEAGAPRHFFCPISMQLMRDPVMLPSGQSYDRPCIERWLEQGKTTCPATGQQLAKPVMLTPNISLRNAIEEWAERHQPQLLDSTTKHLKPLPKESSFALSPAPSLEDDRALAARLQQEEYARGTSRQQLQLLQQGSSQRSRSTGGEDDSRAGWWTLTTFLLLLISAAEVAIVVLTIWQNGWSIEDMQLNPMVGGSQEALLTLGALSREALTPGHQWWRLVTTVFVNAGIIQLLGNLASLWSFGKYLERVLSGGQLVRCAALGGVFLLSGVLGALTSANLNVYYVSCGASAGVCGLMGGVWCDQLIHIRQYKHRLSSFISLTLITAMFVAVSLLPLLDPWYVAGGALTGACCTTILLLLPKVGREQSNGGRPGRRGTSSSSSSSGCVVVIQTLCAALVIAGAAVGVIGLVLDSGVGQECGFCNDVSCLRISWWDCVPVQGAGAAECQLTVLANGSQGLQCPSGEVVTLQQASPTADVQELCDSLCTAAGSDGSSTGNSTTGGSSGGSGSSNNIIK